MDRENGFPRNPVCGLLKPADLRHVLVDEAVSRHKRAERLGRRNQQAAVLGELVDELVIPRHQRPEGADQETRWPVLHVAYGVLRRVSGTDALPWRKFQRRSLLLVL